MTQSRIDQLTWHRHAWRNRLHSLLLLVFMACFLSLLGGLLWGAMGLFLMPVIGLAGAVFSPALSPTLVMRMYRAQPISPQQSALLVQLVAQLSQRAGLNNPPALYYVSSRMLNAFAVGSRNRSAIAITDGLIRQLSVREIAGVLAHEISHIRNNDLWVMGLADTFSRISTALSYIGLFLMLLNLPLIFFANLMINWFAIILLISAPSLTALAQLALSRVREYDADLNAVRLTNDPLGLARALAKIEHVQGGWFEKILMPGRRLPNPSLLRTHPDTARRIERLQALQPLYDASSPLFQHDASSIPDAFGKPVQRRPRWHISGLWH